MAASRASAVRALSERNTSLIFDQHFSMGFRSGEYGGKYNKLAPAASRLCRTAAALWALRLSMTTTWPGRRRGHNTCSTKAWKISPSVASSMVMVASSPDEVMAPNKVRLRQCPAGMASGTRSPFFPHPQLRLITVLNQVSSTKTHCQSSISRAFCRYACRCCCTASQSCSWAWTDFFQPQPHFPAQHHPQRGLGDTQLAVLQKFLLQLRQGQVRLLLQPCPQPLPNGLRQLGLASRLVRDALHLPMAQLLPAQLLHIPVAYPKALGQLLQRQLALGVRLQNLPRQIVGIRSRPAGASRRIRLPLTVALIRDIHY